MTIQNNTQQGQTGRDQDLDAALKVGYQVRVFHETEDPDWDAFQAQTPGGHHVQTSLWAQVKALLGWQAVRVVVTQGEQIVAGAQLLMRPLPLVGTIGYVPKGPLSALDDPVLKELVVNELQQVAKAHRIQLLVIRPADSSEAFAHQLRRWGFRPSPITVVPTATLLIDLTKELDDILAQMKRATRYGIRRSLREGITVREGTERDLPTFYRLLVATCQRQQFSPSPEEYSVKMWRLLRPYGYIRLFLAEDGDEAVSAHLIVPFGDTVLAKRGGWSGRHGRRHPNRVLHRTVIKWAKAQGYRYYDFEGIDLRAARAIVHGEPLSDSLTQSVPRFALWGLVDR